MQLSTYGAKAKPTGWKLPGQRMACARSLAADSNRAAGIAMMARTTNDSMNVNPGRFRFMSGALRLTR